MWNRKIFWARDPWKTGIVIRDRGIRNAKEKSTEN